MRAASKFAAPSVPSGLRVGLFGRFGSGNFGNDGSLAAIIAQVRRARDDARLVCFCNGPARVRERFGIDAVAINSATLDLSALPGRRMWALLAIAPAFVRALLHTRRLDVLVFPGTGVLDDYCCGPLGAPLETFLWCLAARLTGTPVWFVSIGAGPIVGRLSRRLMVWAAKLAQHRSYRDEASKTFLAAAGVDTGVDRIFPDLAFSLPRPDVAPPPMPTVCVGVMDYRGWKDTTPGSRGIFERYQDRLTELCAWLLQRGYAVRLVPGDDMDIGALEGVRDRVAQRLAESSDAGRVANLHAEPAQDLDDVMRQMAGCEAVIASRFHNIVCALMAGCPTLSISYAAKNDVLLQRAGLGDCTQGLETLDVERLKAQFARLVEDSDAIRQRLADFNLNTKLDISRLEALLGQRLAALAPAKGVGGSLSPTSNGAVPAARRVA